MSNPTGSPRRLIRTCVETSVVFVAAYGLTGCGLDGRFSSETVPVASERPASPDGNANQTIMTTRRSSSNQTFQPGSRDSDRDSSEQATSEISSQPVGTLAIDPDTGTLVPAPGSMGTATADAESTSGGSTQTAPDGSSYTTFYGKTLSFTDPVSAADQLASLPDTYMCIAQKATEYALGRPLAAPDQGALEGIFAAFAEARFTWKGLTTAIVNSPLFKEM